MLRSSFYFFFLLVLFIFFPYTVQLRAITVSQNIVLLQRAFEDGSFSRSLELLQQLMGQIRQVHAENINAFFPNDFDNFYGVEIDGGGGDLSSSEEGIGLLFHKRFQNVTGNILDVHVVFQDSSVLEYQNLVQQVKKKGGGDGIRLRRVLDRYDAIESHSDEQVFVDVNVLVSSEVLMNVFYDGLDRNLVLDAFLTQVDYEGLLRYLGQ